MSRIPREKKVLIIGDPALCLIGAAAGTDYFIFRNNCDELFSFLKKETEAHGVYIVLRNIIESCRGLYEELMGRDALTVVIDSPETLEKIDPREYYEKLLIKYVGMKISLQ